MLRKFLAIALTVLVCTASQALAAPRVDIYGPGQNVVNLGLAAPITGPNTEARQMGAQLQKLVTENLSFLPFMRLTDPRTVLGGIVLAGVEPPQADFNRFQLAGSDIVVTTLWPNGDSGTRTVQMRAYETSGGARLFGKEYPNVSSRDLPEVADRFCADLLEVLTGNGAFFRSTLTFVLKKGKMSSQVCLVKPTGRDFRQITNIRGEAMSPTWSPDGRFIVFTQIDERSHSLGVWDARSRRVQRVRFPGDVVIGPSFLPNNKVAVALSNGKYPVIYQLNHVFKKERVLEQDNSINVSPTFDKTGTKMAFTSSQVSAVKVLSSRFFFALANMLAWMSSRSLVTAVSSSARGTKVFSPVSRRAMQHWSFSMSLGPISTRRGTPRISYSANFQPGLCSLSSILARSPAAWRRFSRS